MLIVVCARRFVDVELSFVLWRVHWWVQPAHSTEELVRQDSSTCDIDERTKIRVYPRKKDRSVLI